MTERIQSLCDFLNHSHSSFHAVAYLENLLKAAGYIRLWETDHWDLAPGGKYYLIRGGTALMAFRIPQGSPAGFLLSAAHSDRPCFKVKENAELTGTYTRLAVEKYGGMIIHPWLDRPLSIAGRVLVDTPEGIQTRLIDLDRDIALIPNVAIHMNRDANNGYKYDAKCDTIPLMGLGDAKNALRNIIAKSAGCAEEEILGHDLFLCIRQQGMVWGLNDEFVSAPSLDDLQCAYGCFRGFMEATDSDSLPIFALMDNEEVGSLTKQGADGTLMSDVVERICAALGRDKCTAVANSFLVSADNAHAVHPNHPEYTDATHRPVMNGGIVIKHGTRYATDGAAQAVFTALCDKAGVPVQHFSNRSDLMGGSTLGNIANAHLSMNTVDIGLAQLAMHSCLETAGAQDTDYLVRAMTAFYSASFRETNGVFTLN